MGDAGTTTAQCGTLESLNRESSYSRRSRPPNLDLISGDENRVPLRLEKVSRRESKIGLRNIFGRSKAVKELDGVAVQRDTPGRAGIRHSLVDIGNWPHTLHSPRLDNPAFQPPLSAKSLPARTKTPTHTKSENASKSKPLPATPPRTARGSLATWDPPPLFQAYPQALKHANLPACTISPHALLRFSGTRQGALLRDELAGSEVSPDQAIEAGDKKHEKSKKKHHRGLSSKGSLDWTTKIFVLVTSGYLLQYSGDGSFDRLPEKMLHLTKDSAVFASDLIPGRHWVLQVSSAAESAGTSTPDSRSFLSKLRGSDKRHASNFLLVCESAEEMDSWLATLRREIEALGGKKKLSETGKPKADDHVLQLNARPSQRALVTRDPDRFSRILSQDFSWNGDSQLGSSQDTLVAGPEGAPELALDDTSTSGSLISHDGRQLDHLRDSHNRLSYISSGQRTIVTSAGSSPACSPMRENFHSQPDELLRPQESEVRLRPNAAEIMNRRQSMTMNVFDPRQPAPSRPQSTFNTAHVDNTVTYNANIPNFSVPHGVSKRYSSIKSLPHDPAVDYTYHAEYEPGLKGFRRPPPTALAMSRPLSIVVDQPSPGSPSSFAIQQGGILDSAIGESVETPSTVSTWVHNVQNSAVQNGGQDFLLRESSLLSEETKLHIDPRTSPPRKAISMHNLRRSTHPQSPTRKYCQPLDAPLPRQFAPTTRSSHENLVRPASAAGPRAQKSSSATRHKRMSLQPEASYRTSRRSFGSLADAEFTNQDFNHDFSASMPRLSHLLVSQYSINGDRGLQGRRSMPHLAEGPPPAPPPTCALPPIPIPPQPRAIHS